LRARNSQDRFHQKSDVIEAPGLEKVLVDLLANCLEALGLEVLDADHELAAKVVEQGLGDGVPLIG